VALSFLVIPVQAGIYLDFMKKFKAYIHNSLNNFHYRLKRKRFQIEKIWKRFVAKTKTESVSISSRIDIRKLTQRKNCLVVLIAISVCSIAFLGSAYTRVSSFAPEKMYADPTTCPANDIGILFGCGKFVDGRPNQFYLYRIRAAARLYKAGKIKHLLVSGDNHAVGYNEPETMKRDLVQQGVPATAITCDYAGFSTFETVMRAKEIFGVQTATLITQRYHLPRALYLAAVHGVKAIGYEAREPAGNQTVKFKIREVIARIITFGDVHLGIRHPKFLGKKEYIIILPQQT
jgi:SanA protein